LRAGGAWLDGKLDPETASRLRLLEGRVRVAHREVQTLEAEASPTPARLDGARSQLARSRAELLRFEERLQNRLDDPAALAAIRPAVPEPPRVPVADTESVLFVEYLVGEDRSYAFTFRGRPASEDGSPRAWQGVSVSVIEATATALSDAVTTFRHRLDIRYPRLPIPEGTQLYQWLITPLREHLRPGDLLCVIPDGVLWELPFQALSGPEDRYLIADHAIAYAPSWRGLAAIRTWAERRRARETESPPEASLELDLLALANPALGPTRSSPLPLLGAPVGIPGTEAQARRIAELFAPRSQCYVGSDATEARVRALAGRARILHLATHGVFEPANPMFSGLLLTPGPQDDGYWEAREILQTDLRADLVVLSACETGRGRIRRGEGLWGLSWALFVAGSPANVLSQWAVADESTAVLMTAFYRRLQAGGGGSVHKAEALRQAQLVLLEGREGKGTGYAHPFYWAPFVLMGDWR
jgi:CHAT domain-containing protein